MSEFRSDAYTHEHRYVEESQCGCCGSPATCLLRVERLDAPDIAGSIAICDECRYEMFAHLSMQPDRGPAPLRGYR